MPASPKSSFTRARLAVLACIPLALLYASAHVGTSSLGVAAYPGIPPDPHMDGARLVLGVALQLVALFLGIKNVSTRLAQPDVERVVLDRSAVVMTFVSCGIALGFGSLLCVALGVLALVIGTWKFSRSWRDVP